MWEVYLHGALVVKCGSRSNIFRIVNDCVGVHGIIIKQVVKSERHHSGAFRFFIIIGSLLINQPPSKYAFQTNQLVLSAFFNFGCLVPKFHGLLQNIIVLAVN